MKTYITKPIKVKAIQLTEEMLKNVSPPPPPVYIIDKIFYANNLDGITGGNVGDWAVFQKNDEVLFMTNSVFEENYVEYDTLIDERILSCKHDRGFWFDRSLDENGNMCYRCELCGWSDEDIIAAGGVIPQMTGGVTDDDHPYSDMESVKQC